MAAQPNVLACTCMTLILFQGLANGKMFQSDQQEEDCGIFDASTHKDHEKTPNHNVNILATPKKDNNNVEHLKVDSTKFNRTWPWQVSILHNDRYLCNGLLVKINWVLTTASCLTVVTNDTNSTYKINVNGLMYEGKRTVFHGGFDLMRPYKMAGDIGLLQLTKPVPFLTRMGIYPICLPRSNNQVKQANECAVTYATGNLNNETKTFDSPAKVIDEKFCKRNVNIDGTHKLLICVAVTSEMKFTCSNNQAMFLMCKSSGFWSVFGQSKLCTIAKNEGDKYSYTYYLNIVPYLKWIKEKVRKQNKDVDKKTIM